MQLFHTVSTVQNGSMKSTDQNFTSVLPARRAFLTANDIDPDDTTLVRLTYDTDNFRRYITVTNDDKADGITRDSTIIADALVTLQPGHALFLPLADCIGAVIHDTANNILMLSHLGRHNLEQNGGMTCIEYLTGTHGSDLTNLTVWLSPAAGKATYPLFVFENRSLHEVATEQLLAARIPAENITVSPTDSAVDKNYFSHSQFLKGNRETDGRHAVVAVLR